MVKFITNNEIIIFPEIDNEDEDEALDACIDWEEIARLEEEALGTKPVDPKLSSNNAVVIGESPQKKMSSGRSPLPHLGNKESPITEADMEAAAASSRQVARRLFLEDAASMENPQQSTFAVAAEVAEVGRAIREEFFPYQVLVIGDPVPKDSARHKSMQSKFKKEGRSSFSSWTYNPSGKKKEKFQQYLRKKLYAIHGPGLKFPLFPMGVAVELDVTFAKQPPKRMFVGQHRDIVGSKLKKEYQSSNLAPLKPDTDNCLKFLLDGLKDIAWADDMQCVRINAMKCYDDKPPFMGRTFFKLRTAPEHYSISDAAVPHDDLINDRDYMMGYVAACTPDY